MRATRIPVRGVTAATPDIRPRKQPRQRRSRVTVEIILESAARVLERDSLDGLTTNRVAEVAGVSVGSVYQYFPNKAALAASLIEESQSRLAAEIERLAGIDAPLTGTIAGIAALLVRQQYERPRLAAAIDAEELRLPVGGIVDAARARMIAAIAALAARHGVADSEVAARDCFVIAKAMVEADIVAAGPPPLLAERLSRALLGYLAPRSRSGIP